MMESIASHLPLTLFTALCALGAGGFIGLAIAFFKKDYSADELKAIDKMTLIPLIIVIVGFIAVLFHLTAPLKAFGFFAGIGRSPLSNEVCVGIIFLLVAVIYWIVAFAGKLAAPGARRGFAAVVAVLAVLFGIFMGVAYMIETIPSWCNVGTVCQMLGLTLMGACVASLIFDGAKAEHPRNVISIVVLIGAILAVIGLAAQLIISGGLSDAQSAGSVLVSQSIPFVAVFVIAAIIALVLMLRAGKEKLGSMGMSTCVVVLVFIALFFARIAFYIMEISIGL